MRAWDCVDQLVPGCRDLRFVALGTLGGLVDPWFSVVVFVRPCGLLFVPVDICVLYRNSSSLLTYMCYIETPFR